MEIPKWKAALLLFLLIYGMFGSIHADAVANPNLGNFLAWSGGFCLIAGVVWLVLSFVVEGKRP